MITSSHALKSPIASALATGGDPATSPLYVFGPFLRLVVPAGVASITFGPSIWLVVLTVSVVSLMYRLVMEWITDGTGGTGLSEEEFGEWVAKVNAAITVIEYSLTFLVSMAALVTFLADRLPVLEQQVFGLTPRTVIALVLTAGIAAIMGTTATAMLIVGPAILRVADTSREDVSVFTQTMDALLPAPLAYLGTAVAMGVLVSACATALQGIAHLAHGLGHRRYLLEALCRPNRFGIAERSVWLEAILLCACFLVFGTREETYLALYAAGVFILLSMTGWAAATRLFRRLLQSRGDRSAWGRRDCRVADIDRNGDHLRETLLRWCLVVRSAGTDPVLRVEPHACEAGCALARGG